MLKRILTGIIKFIFAFLLHFLAVLRKRNASINFNVSDQKCHIYR